MSLGGLDGFGSFKGKHSIRRKGAGMAASNNIRYEQMIAELDMKEALKEMELNDSSKAEEIKTPQQKMELAEYIAKEKRKEQKKFKKEMAAQ